jgi:hypothetical protein
LHEGLIRQLLAELGILLPDPLLARGIDHAGEVLAEELVEYAIGTEEPGKLGEGNVLLALGREGIAVGNDIEALAAH